MVNHATPSDKLDALSAAAGISLKRDHKLDISILLHSIREGVMQCVDALPDDWPPSLHFDPR
jgi:hypothetical protein